MELDCSLPCSQQPGTVCYPEPLRTLHIPFSKSSSNVENCALLSCYAASSGNFVPTFRDNLSVASSGFQNIVRNCRSSLLNPLNAELNPICHLLALLEAHHILHVSRVRVNNPEGPNSRPLRGGSVKSRTFMMLSCIIRLGFPSSPFVSRFLTKIFYPFMTAVMRATCLSVLWCLI